ncbi:MAG: sugar ABC transporter ATP-binding protein [Hyphomicrobiales bacterium]|nr:sugar ABC transporter ATP-binding protein [Hyphomicrobiales bacterium]
MIPAAIREPVIVGRGLTQVYGAATVLDDVDIRIDPGEVRALIGSNGAGKSTLVKILTGAVRPTAGTVEVVGQQVHLGSPSEMIGRGVACIYQHSNLAPALSVLDNIFLGRNPTRRLGLVDRPRQRREAQALLARHGIQIDLDVPAGSLPAVKQKEVEILKALALDAKVLLMDEPTGWLASADVANLHATIRKLKGQGVGILYISHMLDEVFAICDTMTILRDGRVVAENAVADISRARAIELMIGRQLAAQTKEASEARVSRMTGSVRLKARGLARNGVFSGVDIDLNAGEILCITGLIGSKRTELVRAIFGCESLDAGSIEIDGAPIAVKSPSEAIAAGIGLVPEDRHRDGLMLGLSVSENLMMATLGRFRRGLLLDRGGMATAARRLIASLNVKPASETRQVRLLSGGNQQKVLLGKWLDGRPGILMLDEPTVGVDVGAKAEIYDILRAARDEGAAILVVSSDIEEVLAIGDRVGVMSAGRLVSVHPAKALTASSLVTMIGEAA